MRLFFRRTSLRQTSDMETNFKTSWSSPRELSPEAKGINHQCSVFSPTNNYGILTQLSLQPQEPPLNPQLGPGRFKTRLDTTEDVGRKRVWGFEQRAYGGSLRRGPRACVMCPAVSTVVEAAKVMVLVWGSECDSSVEWAGARYQLVMIFNEPLKHRPKSRVSRCSLVLWVWVCDILHWLPRLFVPAFVCNKMNGKVLFRYLWIPEIN